MAAAAVEAPDAKKLPPGFRFHPSDEEIVGYYLKNKVSGRKPDIEVIREIDLYKCEPWDLPDKSILPTTKDQEWFFFSPRDKKYPNGSRSNRATEKGYWKATGKDRKVISQSDKIGMKKTLVFYKGRAPHGQRSNWLMHEYRLDETQCIGAPHLKELFVVCRVFRKPKQGLKNGEQYGTTEDFDFSLSKSNLSPPNVNIEESEERSSPFTQEDDTQATSGFRSESSSEIIDNKIEDNAGFDGSMDSLQGRSNPDYSHLTSVNKNANMELGTQEMPSEPGTQEYLDDEELNQLFHSFNADPYTPFGGIMDAYYRDEISNCEDNLDLPFFEGIFDGGNLGYFEQSNEESNNYRSPPGEVNESTPDNGVHFQLRPRPLPWQDHEQPLPSQGTALRRVRLQIYKTDESEDLDKLNGFSGHCQSKCHNCNIDDSETITQMEGSARTSLPKKTHSFEEDDADSSFAFDSAEAFERVTNDHSLTVEPAKTLASCLSTEESSERSENSLTATGSEEESILSVALDALKISGCGQSSCASDGLLIQTIQDNSERPQEQVSKSIGHGVSISVTREKTLMDKSEHVEKREDTISECNSEVPHQASEFGDSLVKGVKLVSHGTTSTELQIDTEISSINAKEMKLVKESTKYSTLEVKSAGKMSGKKGNVESDGVGSYNSMKARAISSHSSGIEEIGINCEGSVKRAGFNLIWFGLKLRGKPGTKDMVFDVKEKSMDATGGFSQHWSKEGGNGSVDLRKAHGIFKWFSKLKSNFSKGSNSISLLMCLLGTVILVFFVKGHMAVS